jgi:F-type H+-transporting ATPase subunit epsilon
VAATFPASIVTPESTVLDKEVEAVMVRTVEGEATFLAGHTWLVGALVPGPVRFQLEDGTEQRVAVHGGFVQVDGNVTVLAPVAELAEDIDVPRARAAAEVAEARVAELSAGRGGAGGGTDEEGSSDRDLVEAQDALRRAQVRLEVAGD